MTYVARGAIHGIGAKRSFAPDLANTPNAAAPSAILGPRVSS